MASRRKVQKKAVDESDDDEAAETESENFVGRGGMRDFQGADNRDPGEMPTEKKFALQ